VPIWFRAQLSIFYANRLAEGVPPIERVGNEHAFMLLRFDFAHERSRANAALDARDLRLDERTLFIAVRAD
jgi:hypothetical protein